MAIARRGLLALTGGLVLSGWKTPVRGRRPRRRRVVALDPGHGGSDPGAISPHGLYEKRVTLATARELAHLLERTGRYRPVLTRRSDVFVPLRKRIDKARDNDAELFLSIHVDALPDTALRGLSVYTLSEKASDREAAALAATENRDDLDDLAPGLPLEHKPHDVAVVLFDLARRHTENMSLRLAHDIVEELGRVVPLLEKPQRSAAFVVLTAPDIPSVLVELGCLTNPVEERLLRNAKYRRRLADGLVAAIDQYFAAIPT